MSRPVALLCLAIAAFVGCGGSSTSEDVAIAFLELYVFNVDQNSALQLADGLAAEKLRAEIASVAEVRRESFTPGQRPPISRELLDVQQEGVDGKLYTYRIEVRPKGRKPSGQRMLIHVQRTHDEWRVANYEFWPDTTSTD